MRVFVTKFTIEQIKSIAYSFSDAILILLNFLDFFVIFIVFLLCIRVYVNLWLLDFFLRLAISILFLLLWLFNLVLYFFRLLFALCCSFLYLTLSFHNFFVAHTFFTQMALVAVTIIFEEYVSIILLVIHWIEIFKFIYI